MKCTGKAVKYGDNVDTDVIIPARYLNTSDPKELAVHCMEDIDKSFHSKINDGDIMVGGENFGCGSSREHAPIAIKASIVECPQAAEAIEEGHTVEADLDAGVITDVTTGRSFKTEPFPEFIQNIISAGGLVNAAKAGIIG